MKNALRDYFCSCGIEYFATISYANLREINRRIVDREGFAPKSAIIYLLPYYSGESVNLSRYAVSLDYHMAIAEINLGIEKILSEHFPDARVKGYGDHSPIDERHAALIAGLGILGDNGLIINEKYGSYVFIADVLTDIDPDLLGASEPGDIARCEGCNACKKACPTGVLSGCSNDCLSAITQRKGELNEDEKALMRKNNTAWGCDICQSVCPHNKKPVLTPVEFFYRDRIDHLTLEILAGMSDSDFEKRAFAWRKRKTIQRNLEILQEKGK